MKIKGTTKIELFDAETGKKTDEIVKDNMVTNAIPNILNPSLQMLMGASQDSGGNVTTALPGFLTRLSPIGRILFGGVLVFSEPLEESVNNIIPSVADRNNIIGYAGNTASLVGNTMRGTYNTTESIELENGFTHVWDFTTEQANGTISAVSLTSVMGGNCGWNTPYNVSNRGDFLIPIVSYDYLADGKTVNDWHFYWNASTAHEFDEVRYPDQQRYYNNGVVTNGAYSMLGGMSPVSNSQFSVTYTVTKLSAGLNLNEPIVNNKFIDNGAVVNEGVWNSDTMPTGYQYRTITFDNVFRLYYFKGGNNGLVTSTAADVFYKDFILNADGTVTVSDITHLALTTSVLSNITAVFNATTGSSLSYVPFFVNGNKVYISDTHIYFVCTDTLGRDANRHFIKMSLSNINDIEVLSLPESSILADGDGIYISKVFGEALISGFYDNTREFYLTQDFINFKRIDFGLNELELVEKISNSITAPYVCLGDSNSGAMNYEYRSANVFLLAPYLATINNLETPVVKTTSKTMKITYTIQNIS